MSIDQTLIATGNTIIGKINYDFNVKYSQYSAIKTLFDKSRQDIVKLAKVIK